MKRLWPKRIVYTRHPICLHNVSNDAALLKGIANKLSPLVKPFGEKQRDITAEYINREFGKFDAVFCSEFLRTREIPHACGYGESMIVSAHLNERNMGVWHLHPRAQVLAMHPDEEVRVREAGYYDYQAPGGESCQHVDERLRTFVDSTAMDIEGSVFISGHGISGLCLRRILTRSDEHLGNMDRLKNASVSVFEREDERYRCTSWNVVPWKDKLGAYALTQGVEA